MTYTICKKFIEPKDFTQEKADDLQVKLNAFLLNDSLNQEQYEELTDLLSDKVIDS